MSRRRAKERETQPYEEEDDAQGRLQDTRNPQRVIVGEYNVGKSMATTAQQAALKRVKDAPRRRGSPSPAKLNKFGANPVQHQEQQSAFGFGQGQPSGSIDQGNPGMFPTPSSAQDSTASNTFDRSNPAPGSVSLVRPGRRIFGSSSGKTWGNVWANKDPEPNLASATTPNPSAFGANPFVAPTFNVSVPLQVPNNPFSNPTNQSATGYQGSLFNIPSVFSQPVPSANNFFSQAAPSNNPFDFPNNSSFSQQPAQVEAPPRPDLQGPTSVFNFDAASNSSTAAPAAPAGSSSIFNFNSNSASTKLTPAPAATPSTSIFTFNSTSKQPKAVSAAPASTDLFSFNSAPKQPKAEQPAAAPVTPVSTGLFSFNSAPKQPEAEQPTAVSTAPASTGLFLFNSAPKQPEAAQPIAVSAAPLSTNLFSSDNATKQSVAEHAEASLVAPPSTSLFSFNSAPTQQAAEPAAPKPNPFGAKPLTSSTNLFSFSPAPKPATESAAITKPVETASVAPSASLFKFNTAEKQSGSEPAATPKSSAGVPLASSANLFSLGATSEQPVAEIEAKPSPQLSNNSATSAPQMAPPADTVSPSSFDFNAPLPPASTQSALFNPFKFAAAPALASNGPIAPPPQDRFAEDRHTLVKPAAPSTVDSMPKTLGTNLFSRGQATPSSTLLNQNLTPLSRSKMNSSLPFSARSLPEDELLVVDIPDAMETDKNPLTQKQTTPVPETKVERKLKKAGSVVAIQSQLDRVESNYLQLCIDLNNATKEKFIGMPSDSRTNVSAWASYYITERRKLDAAFEKKRCAILSQMLPKRNTDHSRSTVDGGSSKPMQIGSAPSGFLVNEGNSSVGSFSVKRKAEEPAENDRTNNANSGKRSRTNEGQQTAQAPTERAKEPASETALHFSSAFKDVMEWNNAQAQESQRFINTRFILHPPGNMQTNTSCQPGPALSGRVTNRIQFEGEDEYESSSSDAEPGQLDEAERAKLKEMRRQNFQRSQQEAEARAAASRKISEQRQIQGVYIGPSPLFAVGQGPLPQLVPFHKTKKGKEWLAARSTDAASGASSNARATAVTKPVVTESLASGTTPVANSQGAKMILTPACDYDSSPEQTVKMPKHMASMRSRGMLNKRNRKRKVGDDESAEEDGSLHDILDQGVAELRASKKFKFMQQAEDKVAIGKPSSTVSPFQKAMAGTVSSTINSSFGSEESSPGVSTGGGASVFDSPKEPATTIPAQNIFGYLSKTNSESGLGNANEDDDNDHSEGSYDGENSYNDQTDDSRNGNQSSRSPGHRQRSGRSQSPNSQSHQDDDDHSSEDREYREHAEGGQSADDKGSQSEGSTYFSRRLGNRLGEAERRRESPDIGYRRSERGRSPSARSIPDEDTRSTSTKVDEPARTGGLFDRISKGSDGKPLRATPADEKPSTGSNVFGQPVIPATTENPFPDPFRTSVLGSGASSGPVFNPFKPKNIFSAEGSPAGDQTWKESTPIKFSSAPLRAFATNDGDRKKDTQLNRGDTSEDAPTPSASEVPKLTFSNPTGGLFGSTPNSPGPNANATKSADVGFTFGGPPKNMASLLMPSAATSITTSRASTPGATTDTGGESATESAVEGEEDSEQLNLSSVGPGEENETVLFEVRAKAFKFDRQTSTFSSHGVGPFRVLKHRHSGKTRILMRSDPNGNVVLNAALLKGIKYDVRQEKIVAVVTVSDDKKFTSWHIKVARHDDAVELSRILEEAKPQ